jgi:hypothetical protein
MKNLDIRTKLKEANIKQWELADQLGIAEMTLVRKLRYELPEEEKQKIFLIIAELTTAKNSKNT